MDVGRVVLSSVGESARPRNTKARPGRRLAAGAPVAGVMRGSPLTSSTGDNGRQRVVADQTPSLAGIYVIRRAAGIPGSEKALHIPEESANQR